MTIHDDIEQAIKRELDVLNGAECLSPTSLALAVQLRFEAGDIQPHIKYTSLEHLKQMARGILRGQFDPTADDDEQQQGEMFSGHLQDRYPIKVPKGSEPQYKLRMALSHEEAQWNIARLRKSAQARLEHADAMQAWNDSRGAADSVA